MNGGIFPVEDSLCLSFEYRYNGRLDVEERLSFGLLYWVDDLREASRVYNLLKRSKKSR